MKRTAIGLLVVVAALTAATTGASAASKPWQVTAGSYKTKAAATAEVSKLGKKGLTGFSVEKERKGEASASKRYEVEKGFANKKSANSELSKVKKAGFKAAVETEKHN